MTVIKEIKFRFKLKLNIERWGKYVKGDTDYFIITLDSLARIPIDEMWDIESTDLYTGLKDKNEKEIFQSDKVKLYYKGQYVECEIYWNPIGMWCLKWKDGYINNAPLVPESLEITGNIYEKK